MPIFNLHKNGTYGTLSYIENYIFNLELYINTVYLSVMYGLSAHTRLLEFFWVHPVWDMCHINLCTESCNISYSFRVYLTYKHITTFNVFIFLCFKLISMKAITSFKNCDDLWNTVIALKWYVIYRAEFLLIWKKNGLRLKVNVLFYLTPEHSASKNISNCSGAKARQKNIYFIPSSCHLSSFHSLSLLQAMVLITQWPRT